MAALRRDFDGRPAIAIGAIVGAAGAIGVAIGFAVKPERAFGAYLAAWCTVATIAIGGLIMLAIGYAANARWPAAVRRPSEAVALALAPVAVLVLPLLVAPGYVWPWAAGGAERLHAVAVKRTYLSIPFFTLRTVVYLAVFVIAAEVLRRWSRRRDDHPLPPVPHGIDSLDRERRFASAMLPVMGLAITFASFDWLMSLQPDWWSSAFGLYLISACL
ncbi:MAG: hypothetical protein ACM31C_13680, partial [Acidobacteriota bacterium]